MCTSISVSADICVCMCVCVCVCVCVCGCATGKMVGEEGCVAEKGCWTERRKKGKKEVLEFYVLQSGTGEVRLGGGGGGGGGWRERESQQNLIDGL